MDGMRKETDSWSVSFLQLGDMYPRCFQHQFFGADRIKRHLDERIAAHGYDGDDHSIAEGLVVDLIARGELQQRRGGGRLLRCKLLQLRKTADGAASRCRSVPAP